MYKLNITSVGVWIYFSTYVINLSIIVLILYVNIRWISRLAKPSRPYVRIRSYSLWNGGVYRFVSLCIYFCRFLQIGLDVLVEGWTPLYLIPHNTLYLNHIWCHRTRLFNVNAIYLTHVHDGLPYVNQLGRYILNPHRYPLLSSTKLRWYIEVKRPYRTCCVCRICVCWCVRCMFGIIHRSIYTLCYREDPRPGDVFVVVVAEIILYHLLIVVYQLIYLFRMLFVVCLRLKDRLRTLLLDYVLLCVS